MPISIIILVISSKNINIYNNFKQTWLKCQDKANRQNLNIKIFFTYGIKTPPGAPDCILSGTNDLHCNTHESPHSGCNRKTIMAFEFIRKNYEFDYLIQSNLSSIIVPERLIDYMKDKPTTEYFGGRAFMCSNQKISNWIAWTVSKDIVDYCIEKKSQFLTSGENSDVLFSKVVLSKYSLCDAINSNGMYCITGDYNTEYEEVVVQDNDIVAPRLMNLDKFISDPRFFWARVRNDNRNIDVEVHTKISDALFA